jgi:histidyl-tRNA synthetase
MLQPARGTRDILNEEMALKEVFLKTFHRLAKNYGFRGIETPIFESTDVFKRTLGETSDVVSKEMYTFEDRGGSSMTLRPEGTAGVVRALISNGLTQTLPQKFFYSGPMFRYERPQKGRYRQLHQACVEYIGSAHPFADIEVISFAYNLLKSLNIHDVILNINTLGDLESRTAYRKALIEYFNPYKNDLSDDSKIRLEKNPLRILDSKDEHDQKICENAPIFANYLNDPSQSFYNQVLEGLEALNIPYICNPKVVRGLDYYTHTAFEFKTDKLGAQDAVLGGGRYDNLVKQMGGPDIPAVGFGMGIERICMLMDKNNIIPQPLIGILPLSENEYKKGLILSHQLRLNNIGCELPLKGNLNKRFKHLEQMQCRVAILFGPEEKAQNSVKFKYLQQNNKKEEMVSTEDIINYIQENQLF